MNFKPYCPQCGSVAPDELIGFTCIPCGNQGHYYRLVLSEKDRQDRIQRWIQFYRETNAKPKELLKIPSWINLNNIPAEALL